MVQMPNSDIGVWVWERDLQLKNEILMCCMLWYIVTKSLPYCSLQISMNATLQMEAVNTVVPTLLGASSAAVKQATSWMKMD